jgi:hypothetical protein
MKVERLDWAEWIERSERSGVRGGKRSERV